MRKVIFAIAVCGFFATTSCKRETVTTQTTETDQDGKTVTTTTTTTTDTDYDLRLQKAESDYKSAENDVKVAHEKGDTKAEKIAQDAADKAKEAWEVTKSEVRKGVEKTKEAIKDVGDGISNSVKKKDTVILK